MRCFFSCFGFSLLPIFKIVLTAGGQYKLTIQAFGSYQSLIFLLSVANNGSINCENKVTIFYLACDLSLLLSLWVR